MFAPVTLCLKTSIHIFYEVQSSLIQVPFP